MKMKSAIQSFIMAFMVWNTDKALCAKPCPIHRNKNRFKR